MSYLTPGQEKWAQTLASFKAPNGKSLDLNVARAWALAEMSGDAAKGYDAKGYYNYGNIAKFDSGPGALSYSQRFSTPEGAAQAQWDFLSGKWGGADPRIQAILRTAGQSPQAQLRAIYTSPWASSHYGNGRDLLGTYKMVSGMPVPAAGSAALPAPSTSPTATGLDAQMAAAADPTAPQTSAAQLRRSSVQGIINNIAHIAKIPTITLPQISAPVQVEAPMAKRAVASGNPTAVAAVGSQVGNAVVAAAKQFLGMSYSWGGGGINGPSTGFAQGAGVKGFDCSSLVQYAIHKATGLTIARVTYDQVKAGKAVARNQLRPGDLVFFGTWSDPHHVAIYAGNNQIVEAPHTGAVIRLTSLAGRSDYLTARRYA